MRMLRYCLALATLAFLAGCQTTSIQSAWFDTTYKGGPFRKVVVLASDGTINTRTQSLQKQVTKNSQQQDKLNDRVDLFQKRLIAQYTQLDANVAKLNALQSYVTQQIAQMNRSSSSS